MTSIRAYTSDVYALGPSVGCAVVAVAVAVGVLVAVRAPLPALLVAAGAVAAVVAGFVALTAHVRVAVNATGIAYRVGFGRWRRFDRAAMRAAECVRLGAGAIVGIGIPFTAATARHVVRSGSVLHLCTGAGEHVWLSVREPVPDDLLPVGARRGTP
jgi:hypothetical protein